MHSATEGGPVLQAVATSIVANKTVRGTSSFVPALRLTQSKTKHLGEKFSGG
jgi:hypothetical protein